MLKKELRIKKERDFKKVYNKGAFIGGSIFNINYLITRGEITRVAVAISKKVAKKAVDRNSLKRKVREGVRLLYPNIKNGVEIIINIKAEAKGKKMDTLKEELEKQLSKKQLLKDKDNTK